MSISIIVLIIIIFFLLYLLWQHDQQIKKLTDQVRAMIDGKETIDIRDHHEGSLSILRSDIYKLAKQLTTQTSLRREEKVKLKEILFDVSHQLKTPLTSMTVMADLLAQENLPAVKRVEFMNNLQISLERMDWLVRSLLKLAQLDAGAQFFKIKKVALSDLVQQATIQLDTIINVKKQKFILDIDEKAVVLADSNWTVEALLNVLKNAVEHSADKSEILISVGESAIYKWISVTNSGVIDRDDLAHLFQRFYKGKNATKDSVGIGLAMSLAIMQKQNGDIEVKSSVTEGTTFFLKFYK